MPTAVSAARQCLAGEAAAALDGAVAIARRRAHTQTTSLHVVSALLSLPSSSPSLLRDALSRARSAFYPSRLQSRALEVCFSAALDRLPSAASSSGGGGGGDSQQGPAEPPVSNSLMAAIKRSQANQRRNPDAFHIYQQQYPQQEQQTSPSAGARVELQQLVLSILDDPVVSRVFGEAGFRSYDMKIAIFRPPPSVLRYPHAGGRCPPLFLCNFSLGADDFDLTSRSFPFPLSPSQPLSSDGADENCRRIADVLKRGRNALLIGVGGGDAARDFQRAIEDQKWASFPPEFCRLQFFSVEKEVAEFVGGRRDRPWVDSRFHDMGLRLAAAECLSSQDAVLCFGDLKRLVDMVGEEKESDGLGKMGYVVAELTRVVDGHPGRLWLMGWAATYETYMKFLSLCPSADKDWNLQLLPITSLKPGSGDLLPGPKSLMESFVPFGGFFSNSTDSVAPLSRQYNSSVPCQLCNDKYEQEVAALFRELSAPDGVEYQVNLHPFQQQPELITINSALDMEKAKDDGTTLSAKIMDLQKKWNDICQHQCQGSQIFERVASETFSRVNGIQRDADKQRSSDPSDRNVKGSQGQNIGRGLFPVVADLHKITSPCQGTCMPMIPEVNGNLLSKLQGRSSKNELPQTSDSQSHSGALSLLGRPDDLTSPSSLTSVSTDLMLGSVHTYVGKAEKSMLHPRIENFHDLHGCIGPKDIDKASGNVSAAPTQYSSCAAYADSPGAKCLPVQSASYPKVAGGGASASDWPKQFLANVSQPFDIQDFKTFFRSLTEKVGWQEDAIHAISKSIVCCKADNRRLHGPRLKGDIWLSFLGPDRVGKRKIAMALAELLFGSREKFICVDVNSQDEIMHSNTICNNEGISGYELSLRGKTVVDHIAGEICKKPWSVVLLENVDKADLLVQTSLSQAIKTGRFSNSHGREVAISNAVFVTTAGTVGDKSNFLSKSHVKYTEEMILAAKPWQMKVLVVSASYSVDSKLYLTVSGTSLNETRSASIHARKRKLNTADPGDEQCPSMGLVKRMNKNMNTCFDLNLPVEEMGANHIGYTGDENNCMSDDMSAAWMEEFFNAVDESVNFKPFDFDVLANDILEEINESFRTALGSEYLLEIDPKVMEQILAATWLSEGKGAISNWIQQVLARSFIEAQEVHHLPPQSVFRLVACDDAFVEDYAPGIHLPLRILLN